MVHSPYVPITALFRATVVHRQYAPITALFRATVVHTTITVLLRTTVVHTTITVLLRTTVVHTTITVLIRTTGCSQSVRSDNGPFQGHRGSQSVSPDNGPFQGHHGCTTVNPVTNTLISSTGRANYIKLVHWNAQGAISKTSAIQTTIVQDDIDIVMIQDTRYKRRPDDLPNLRIQGYHTYHRTMDEGGHGLVTLVKHTIPSEAADQVDLGDGTETLSTRIWINNKPLLLHNLYRVNGVLDVTTTLTREPRSILAGDFNARDERWCRANNPAGRLLNEQIQDLGQLLLDEPSASPGPQFTRRLSIFQLFRLTWLRQQAGPSTLDFLVIILRSNWRYKSGPPLEELRA